MKRQSAGMASFARQLACLLVAATLAASSMAGERVAAQRPEADRNENLTGWLLVAAPRMRDPRFSRAVIFLAHHDDKGAFGLIVNRLISVRPAAKLLGDILGEDAPDGNGGDEREIRIHYGGPVQPTHWNFIHSNDYTGSGTIVVTPKVSLTRNQEILRALANGKGPAKGFLAIGYAGWGPGQLEGEIKRKSWITVGPDDGIIFDNDMETKWQRAMDKRGVEL